MSSIADELRIKITRQVASSVRPMRLLDIGCGGCVIADIFSESGHDVTVCDRTSRRVPARWRNKFILANGLDAPLDDFEGVIIAGLLYHLSEDSQNKLMDRVSSLTCFVDTHYVEGDACMRRKPTTSSEDGCAIPSWQWLMQKMRRGGPDWSVRVFEPHTDLRRWVARVKNWDIVRKDG